MVEKDGIERLYFIVETKGSLFTEGLRGKEGLKIECGKMHFQALAVMEDPSQYVVARNMDDFVAHC